MQSKVRRTLPVPKPLAGQSRITRLSEPGQVEHEWIRGPEVDTIRVTSTRLPSNVQVSRVEVVS
jgi:hypothetical protein